MSDTMTAEHPFTAEEDARIAAHIRARGLTFEVFLPEGIADWLWQKLEAGVYKDPKEVAFIAFQDLMDLDRHPKVRAKLLKATLNEYASTEPPTPRTWISGDNFSDSSPSTLPRSS